MPYRIREVDGEADADELTALHHLTFGDHVPLPDFTDGFWWIVYAIYPAQAPQAIGFCGISQSTWHPTACYFKRAGIMAAHYGKGLQKRMIRVRCARARREGWTLALTDTTDNPASANNLMACGFRLFAPAPWAWNHSLYWRRKL